MKNENAEMWDAPKKDVILASRPEAAMKEAFKIIEPSGKTYRVYEDGRVEGFKSGSIVFNRIPMLLREAQHSISSESACPISSVVPARGGASHSLALTDASHDGN